jgi:uncharacterized membrane protein
LTPEIVRMTVLIIIAIIIAFGGGFYFHEKYWPKLQEVLREMF